MTMTINELIVEDQRDVAVDALNDIRARCLSLRTNEKVADMSIEEIFNLLSATIAIVNFIAHSAADRVEEMQKLKFL